MLFGIVETRPYVLNFLVLDKIEGAKALGWNAFTLNREEAPLSKIIHLGMTGGAPASVYQFAPRWLAAEAGVRLRAAANPEGDEEEKGRNKGMPDDLKYHSGELGWGPTARKRRDEETATFRAALKAAETGGWRWAVERAATSGFDLARHSIQRMRHLLHHPEGVENFFYCMCFAMLTANEGTATAEHNLESFAHILRARGLTLTEAQFKRDWKGGQPEVKWKAFRDIRDTWPRLKQVLLSTRSMDRKLRREVAEASALPGGLGTIKFTFSLECMGQDVACLDRWMFRALGANEKTRLPSYPGMNGYIPQFSQTATGPLSMLEKANKRIVFHNSGAPVAPPPWKPFTDGSYLFSEWGIEKVGSKTESGGVSTEKLNEYEWWEDRIKKTVFYKEVDDYPCPLARGQWTMWESIMRTHPKPQIFIAYADHKTLLKALSTDKERFDREWEEHSRKRKETFFADPAFAQKATIVNLPVGPIRRTGMKALRETGTAIFEKALSFKRGKIRRADAAVRTLAEKHTEKELLAMIGEPSQNNPSVIGRVFSEALAWKRGEVNRASPQARELAERLSAKALAEFARMA